MGRPRSPRAAAAADTADLDGLLGRYEATLLADDDRRYVAANQAACDLLGRPLEEVLRLTVDDLAPPEARPWVADAWSQFIVEGTQAGSMVIERPDGSVRHVEFSARSNVSPGVHRSILRDVSDRVTAEIALRSAQEELALQRSRADRTETQLLLALGQIPTVVWSQDVDLRFTYVSHFRYGLPSDILGRTDLEVWPLPEDAERLVTLKRRVLATGTRVDEEFVITYPEGPRICQISIAPLFDAEGRPIGLTGATTDVTLLREAERSAQRSRDELVKMVEERTRELSESRRLSDLLFAELDVLTWVENVRTGSRTYVSPGIERILGLPKAEFFDDAQLLARVHEEDRDELRVALAHPESSDVEFRVLGPDGAVSWLRRRTSIVRDGAGEPVLRYGIVLNVTSTRQAEAEREAAIRTSEQRLRELIDGIDAVVGYGEGNERLVVSDQVRGLLGREPASLTSLTAWDELVHPDDYAACRAVWDGPAESWAMEYRLRHADGRWIWVRDRSRRLFANGAPPSAEGQRYFFVITDVTAVREAEAERIRAVEESAARYRRLIESQNAFFWEEDLPTHEIRYISPQAATMTGFPVERWMTERWFWRSLLHPDDRDRVLAAYRDGHDGPLEYRFVRADGRPVWVREHATTVTDEAGRPMKLMGVVFDITAVRAAEDEHRMLEERLEEVARLEALARVAATTAHDFGNVLLGIDLFSRHLAKEGSLTEKGRTDVARIRDAVEQGRGAANALVALGRLADPALVPTDVHEALTGLELSLAGLLGPRIQLRLSLAAPDPVVELDPGALERSLINLALNARDAISGPRGTVAISTSEVEEDETVPTSVGIAYPGRYLSIAITDTGDGMDRLTLARAFEPYFTTKPVGKGTGLGLSSVHGLVRAADGHIHATSSRGGGTTFRICLPVAVAPLRPGGDATTSADAANADAATNADAAPTALLEP